MSKEILNWHTSHFDLLEDYDGEIPTHVALYLNDVKTRRTINAITSHFPVGSRIEGLDVGCGTGVHALTLQKLLGSAVVHGLDGSKKQLDKARAKGFPNNLIHADMASTGLSDSCFDFIVAVNSLHHLPSHNIQFQTLSEFERLLRPNGLLLIHEISIRNPIMRFYMKIVFPRTRSIDNGTEIFLKHPPIGTSAFETIKTAYFTFVPDFTPKFLMPIARRIDSVLSNSPVSKMGAHVFWVLRNTKSS
jgi:SAM-dependent methyltransferase